jgi:hypothetical protein
MSAGVDRSIPCPQCGVPASGVYCSACGTKLEGEGGLGEEIGGKLREPLTAGLALLKTTWLVLFAPMRFFAGYFNKTEPLAAIGFPLAPVWQRLSAKPQKVLSPFQCLAGGLVSAAFCNTLSGWIDAITQMPRHNLNDPAFRRWFAERYGHELMLVDLHHLTGLSVFDETLYQVIALLDYSLAAVMNGWLLLGTGVQPRQYLHYHAYAVGTALTLRAFAFITALALASLTVGLSTTIARLLAAIVLVTFGLLPMLWFIAFLPVSVFTRVLAVRRGRMIVATAGGLALAAAFNVWSTQTTLFGGLVFVW